jgi:hypothetical protein
MDHDGCHWVAGWIMLDPNRSTIEILLVIVTSASEAVGFGTGFHDSFQFL